MQKSTKTDMTEENMDPKFKLKEMSEKRIYFIEKIKQNQLMSEKEKKVFR